MSDSPSSVESKVNPEEQNQETQGDAASSEPEEWIQLNPKQLQAEINRLREENPDFLRIFNTEVGNAAARKYQPQIQARDRQLESERKLRRRLEIERMDEKEIETKFASDPEFAREYADLVHFKPQEQVDDPSDAILEAVDEMISEATAQGLPKESIDKLIARAQAGEFGTPDEHWSRGVARLQRAFTLETVAFKAGSTPPPAVNPKVTKGGPVGSSASRGADGGKPYNFKTAAEFNALPRAEQERILNDPDGLAAVEQLAKG